MVKNMKTYKLPKAQIIFVKKTLMKRLPDKIESYGQISLKLDNVFDTFCKKYEISSFKKPFYRSVLETEIKKILH